MCQKRIFSDLMVGLVCATLAFIIGSFAQPYFERRQDKVDLLVTLNFIKKKYSIDSKTKDPKSIDILMNYKTHQILFKGETYYKKDNIGINDYNNLLLNNPRYLYLMSNSFISNCNSFTDSYNNFQYEFKNATSDSIRLKINDLLIYALKQHLNQINIEIDYLKNNLTEDERWNLEREEMQKSVTKSQQNPKV